METAHPIVMRSVQSRGERLATDKRQWCYTVVCLAHTTNKGEVRQRKANFILSQKVKIA